MWFRISEVIIADCIVWPVHLPGRCDKKKKKRVQQGHRKGLGDNFIIIKPLRKPIKATRSQSWSETHSQYA